MAHHLLFALPLLLTLLPTTHAALRIASALSVIEWTPELIAAEDFYPPGNSTVTIVNGGVPNLFPNSTNSTTGNIDLASNAETQSLRNYASHRNLRIIYTISEVAYRIVADKRKIPTAKDLKGKKIGAVQGTSSGYFVEKFLQSSAVGAKKGEYEVVNGGYCLKEPCGNNTLPAMLMDGRVDAVGFWEPTVELAARAIGQNNSIFFQDFDVYREIFSLHTTKEKLDDPRKRREIVEFLRSLEKALGVFRDEPERVYARAAKAVGMEESMMRAVWPVHRWPGTIPRDLLDVLVEEDAYVAGLDNRTRLDRDTLRGLVDWSVLEEARDGGDEDGERK